MTGPVEPDRWVSSPLLRPGDYRVLQRQAADSQAFAFAHRGDPAGGPELELCGFEVTDLRRFVRQLDEAELVEDQAAEDVARALIAGYVRAAVATRDRIRPRIV